MVENRGSYLTYLASDFEEVAAGSAPFLVTGVISSAVTLVYGRSEAGKSMITQALLAAMVAGEASFLGREVQQAQWNAGVLTGDYGDGVRYSRRLASVLGPEGMARIRIFDASGAMPFDGWANLLADMQREGRRLLVVDNLSAFVPGDINSGPACQMFFDALSRFTGAGIAVVVIAHSTEKSSREGIQDFIGHSSIKQRPGWHCKVSKRVSGDKVLSFHGNDGSDHEITVRQQDPAVPAFEVVSVTGPDEMQERRERRSRQRATGTLGRRDQIRQYVLAECQGRNRNQTADAIAARFPSFGKASTHQGQLSRGSYGVRLSAEGLWEELPAAA